MPRLRDFEPLQSYRSGAHCIGVDFYGEVLPRARRYARAVGFFSSSAFSVAARPFADFFAAGHVMQLVCSPWLSQADAEGFYQAIRRRGQALKAFEMASWPRFVAEGKVSWSASVEWLIARGRGIRATRGAPAFRRSTTARRRNSPAVAATLT